VSIEWSKGKRAGLDVLDADEDDNANIQVQKAGREIVDLDDF